MPNVPTVKGPQVKERAVSDLRASDAAFGAGQSKVAGASRELLKTIEKEKVRADNVEFQRAYSDLLRVKNDLLYNPDTGYSNQKGINALQSRKQYQDDFSSNAEDIKSSLMNEDQKIKFDIAAGKMGAEYGGNLNRHASKEKFRYETEQTAATVESLEDDAVLNYRNAGKVGENLQIQKAVISDFGASNGQSPEQIAKLQEDAATKVHSSVINRMLVNDEDQLAEQYFKLNKGDIDGSVLPQIEKSIEASSLRGKSQRTTDALMAKNDDPQAAYEQALQINDPKLRDETRRRLKQRITDKKFFEDAASRELFEDSVTSLERSYMPSAPGLGPAKPRGLDSIPAGEFDRMTHKQKSALRKYDEILRKGERPTTDWTVWRDLTGLAANPTTRDVFKRKPLMEFRHLLADPEFKEVVKLQNGLIKGEKGSTDRVETLESRNTIINRGVSIINANADDSEKKERAAKFWKKVEQEALKIGKKDMTNDQLRDIVDRMSTNIIVGEGWFFNDTKFRFNLSDKELDAGVQVSYDDIPAQSKDRIEAELYRRGETVTEDVVQEIYLEELERQRRFSR